MFKKDKIRLMAMIDCCLNVDVAGKKFEGYELYRFRKWQERIDVDCDRTQILSNINGCPNNIFSILCSFKMFHIPRK